MSLLPSVLRSHPFFYFPVFYGMKGFVEGRSPQAIYDKYRAELWDNCKALWTIWVPAQLVNFSVVPRHLRIPFGEDAAGHSRARLGARLTVSRTCRVPTAPAAAYAEMRPSQSPHISLT